MSRKCLITGGAGFIGSHLCERLLNDGFEIQILDNFRTGSRENLKGKNVRLIEGSVTDREVVREAVQGCETVYHLAAMVSVPESMSDPLGCAEINVKGLLHVLEESASAGVKKLVFASSAAIYGDDPVVPKKETMTPDPRSPYAITKLDGEYYCSMFTRTGRLSCACLRFFNVFGPRQDPKSAYAAAVPIFIGKALAGDALTVYGDGEQTRDFVYVLDVVEAIRFAAEKNHVEGVFNVGYGQSTTINRILKEILTAAKSESPVQYEPTRAGDVRHSLASVDRLREAGFRPVSSLETGLADTLQYFSQKQTP